MAKFVFFCYTASHREVIEIPDKHLDELSELADNGRKEAIQDAFNNWLQSKITAGFYEVKEGDGE